MPTGSEGTENPSKLLRSGDFVLDVERQRLTRRGAAIPLSGQPLQILAILLAAPGRVVTREELKAALWPGMARIDTERRLNTAMRALREALGDGAETPLFVETIRGRGYRWIEPEATARKVARARPSVTKLALAAAAALALGSAHRPAPAAPPAAQELFVQIAAGASDQPQAAVERLDALISDNPRYVAANALRAQLAMQLWREAPNLARLEQARAAVSSAQRVSQNDAGLQSLSAELALGGDWDWKRAERGYRRALQLDPANADARRGLAWLLLNAGRAREAFAELEPVLSRADLTDDLRAEIGWLLLRMERNQLALSVCGAGMAAHVNVLACRHTAAARSGNYAAARDAALALMRRVSADRRALAAVQRGSPENGYRRFLAWRADRFLPNDASAFQRAQVQAEAGQTEAAVTSLEHAYAAREPALVKLWSTREFVALRGSPRFQALWRAVGPAR